MIRRSTCLALLSLLLAGSVPAQEEPVPAVIQQVVAEVLDRFPRLEGRVLEAEGGVVRIDLGTRDRLPAGVELTLFREGRELRHPRTGQLLGHVEEPLGRVAVQEVHEQDATARVVEGAPGATPKPGDRVRLTTGRVRLALLSLIRPGAVEEAGGEDPVTRALARELERTGRFRVVFADRLKVWLLQQGLSAEAVLAAQDRLAELRQRFRVDYLLVATPRLASGQGVLDVQLLSLEQRRPLLTATHPLGPLAQLAEPPPRRAGPGPAQPEPSALVTEDEPVPLPRSPILESFFKSGRKGTAPLAQAGSLKQLALAVDVAEVRGSGGSPQLVLTDGEAVSFYRLTREGLQPEGSWSPGTGTLIGVQFADLEGAGQLEVVVNRYLPGLGMASLILAAPPAPIRPLVNDIPQILLAVDEDGDGVNEALWAQAYDPTRFFSGRVVRYRYRNGRLTTAGPVEVPRDFRATGAVLANLSRTGKRELVYIDADRYLVVAHGRTVLWRSQQRVGGSYLAVEANRPQGRVVHLEPNLLARDLDRDGVEEVLVPRNPAAGLSPSTVREFAAGEVVILSRKAEGLTLEALGPQFDGVVSGVALLSGEVPTLLFAIVKRAGTRGRGGESRIFLAKGS